MPGANVSSSPQKPRRSSRPFALPLRFAACAGVPTISLGVTPAPKCSAPSSLKVSMWSFGPSTPWSATTMCWSFTTNPRASRSVIAPNQVVRPRSGTPRTFLSYTASRQAGKNGSRRSRSSSFPIPCPLAISKPERDSGAAHQGRSMRNNSGSRIGYVPPQSFIPWRFKT